MVSVVPPSAVLMAKATCSAPTMCQHLLSASTLLSVFMNSSLWPQEGSLKLLHREEAEAEGDLQ